MASNNKQQQLGSQNREQQGFNINFESQQQTIVGTANGNQFQMSNISQQQDYQQQIVQSQHMVQQSLQHPSQQFHYIYQPQHFYQQSLMTHYYPQEQQHFLTDQYYPQHSIQQTSQQRTNVQFQQQYLQPVQQYMPERESEAETMFVGEICDVTTSSPTPDFSDEIPTTTNTERIEKQPDPSVQKQYSQPQQQIVMTTKARNITGAETVNYGLAQQRHYMIMPSSQNANRMAMAPSTAYQGQQTQVQRYQQFLQTQQTNQNASSIRRSTPFEEEEEEEEEDKGNKEMAQEQQNQNMKHEYSTMELSQIDEFKQKETDDNNKQKLRQIEPRLDQVRSNRRKQIFESNNKPITARKNNLANSTRTTTNKKCIEDRPASNEDEQRRILATKKSLPKREKEIDKLSRPLLFDKVHAQAVQRIATVEGWRCMNEWIKSAIKTMNLAKLRQLLLQLTDADISVKLLQNNDTPKLVSNLQKCADKEIANLSTKMVTKWKQIVLDANKAEKQITDKMSKQQSRPSPFMEDKISRRSTDSNIDLVNHVPTSNSNMRSVASDSILIKETASTSACLNQHSGSKTGNTSKQSTLIGSLVQEKPKMTAKAKAKISRPRLTGLEGEDEQSATSSKLSAIIKKNSDCDLEKPNTAISESPLSKIMAASAKFQAQQPKRKPVAVMFSDNFMDSLSAPDISQQPKKPKIVRKKLIPTADSRTTPISEAVFSPHTTTESIDAFKSALQTTLSVSASTTVIKRRVRFSDEFGRDLVEVRLFEIEEGERINVTKIGGMSKEEIKHFDSQREKQVLLDARRHGFGGFSSITDPLLMPPSWACSNKISPTCVMPTQFGMPKTDSRFPWKLHLVDFQPVITMEPGSKSVAKFLELERQKTILPALVLPTPLPVSDIDEQELKLQQEESLVLLPKIIPLDLITEMSESQIQIEMKNETDGNGVEEKFEQWNSLEINKEGENDKLVSSMHEEPMEIEQENEKENAVELVDEIVHHPIIHLQSSNSDEDSSDVEMFDIEEQEKRENFIASPVTETLEESLNMVDSVKKIPTEQIGCEEDKEDLDIRDLQHDILLKQQLTSNEDSPNANTIKSPFSTTTLSPDISALLRKQDLSSLMQHINRFCGPSTKAGEKSSNLTITTSITKKETDKLPNQQNQERLTQSTMIIPPPPTHLYPNHPPPSIPATNNAPLPPRHMPLHIQQLLFGSVDHGLSVSSKITFPPPNFSTPPPQIEQITTEQQLTSTTMKTTTTSNLGTGDVIVTTATRMNTIPPIGYLPSIPKLSDNPENGKINKKSEENQQEQNEGAGAIHSPGPPGLDEGGSPPFALEQQSPQKQYLQSQQFLLPPPQQRLQQSVHFQQTLLPSSTAESPQQQPLTTISMAEARNVVGNCAFFMRTNTCKYGDKCKFAHDDGTITLGVQMAMRGVNIAGRGGLRGIDRGGAGMGRGQRVNSVFHSESAGGHETSVGGRRGLGGNNRYDLSLVRNHENRNRTDRRFRLPSRQSRGRTRSRSHDRDSYNKNYRRRSRSRRNRNGRNCSEGERSKQRHRSSSRSKSSSISSSSSSTYSRSPSPIKHSENNRQQSPNQKESERERSGCNERNEESQKEIENVTLS